MLVLTMVASLVATILVILASKILTNPIHHMIDVIRQVKQGPLDQQMQIDSNDELGELAAAFNRMTEIIQRNQEMEAALAQQGKMASLGVLSSGVAHEINNPLGVILGYASYLEGKLEADHPHFTATSTRSNARASAARRSSRTCSATPAPPSRPWSRRTSTQLLGQIIDFAANHTDMHHVADRPRLRPRPAADPGRRRPAAQVAINLILNAGAAMRPRGGS